MPPSLESGENRNALAPRVRVVVRGNSTGVNVGPVRESRAQGTYPEMLERFLRRDGVDALILNHCSTWERINDVFPDWFEPLSQLCPDVVVLNYGGAECQAHIFPTRFMAWVQKRRVAQPLGPIKGRISRLVDRRLRRFVARTIRLLSPRIKMRTWRLRPARFAAELERLIRAIRGKTMGLVLVMTVSPASPGVERLWWNLNARCARYSEIIRGVVTRADDPSVRLIDLDPIHARLGPKVAMYDGLHWTAKGHEAIAEQMCAEIERWMAETGIW